MGSTVDAAEMTVDPVFVINPDLADDRVSPEWRATERTLCGNGKRAEDSDRQLDLGRSDLSVSLPSERWLDARDTTEFAHIAPLREHSAVLIEQMGPSGAPEVLVESQARAAGSRRALSTSSAAAGGGCNTGTGGVGASLLALAALYARRRYDRSGA